MPLYEEAVRKNLSELLEKVDNSRVVITVCVLEVVLNKRIVLNTVVKKRASVNVKGKSVREERALRAVLNYSVTAVGFDVILLIEYIQTPVF